jgi:hypothetical protein
MKWGDANLTVIVDLFCTHRCRCHLFKTVILKTLFLKDEARSIHNMSNNENKEEQQEEQQKHIVVVSPEEEHKGWNSGTGGLLSSVMDPVGMFFHVRFLSAS